MNSLYLVKFDRIFGITCQIMINICVLDLLGHGFPLHRSSMNLSLHLAFVEPSTVQSSSPCSGAGHSHTLVRFLGSAPPKLEGQNSQPGQSPQSQLTNESNLYVCNIIACTNLRLFSKIMFRRGKPLTFRNLTRFSNATALDSCDIAWN